MPDVHKAGLHHILRDASTSSHRRHVTYVDIAKTSNMDRENKQRKLFKKRNRRVLTNLRYITFVIVLNLCLMVLKVSSCAENKENTENVTQEYEREDCFFFFFGD